jgi:2-keto-4-pentenoate hydratase/2-oxohepta-3-ene-1,7-dioic acid hydratase in catechol pathway
VASGVSWALATIDCDGRPLACLEVGGKLYRLEAPVIDLLADWERSCANLDATAAAVDPANAVPEGRRLAPLLYPGKVLCAGANYYDHLAEMGMPGAKKADQRLFFFFKPARNAVVGEGDTVRMPIGTKAFDWEVELAAVIGRKARAVKPEQALDHIAGYMVGIDFSARDHNRAPETFYKLDWVAGKANDTCCPLGPRFVPAAIIGNPQDLGLKLSVNGEIRQNARTSGMIFSIAEQIAMASRIMTLDAGDVLLTGTPAGVGVPKATFLSVGDRVDAEIESIGRLSVTIGPPDA